MIEGYSGDETKGSNQDPKEKSITDNTLEQVVFHKITGMDDIEKKMDVDPHSKLIEILTGIEDTQQKDVDFMQRMFEDRRKFFDKYGIEKPENIITEKGDLDAYYNYIVDFAKQKDIQVETMDKAKIPFDTFGFTPDAFFHKGIIYIADVKDSLVRKYFLGSSILHEVVHALQEKSGKQMSPEEEEYEAYIVANLVEEKAFLEMQSPEISSDRTLFAKRLNEIMLDKIIGSSLFVYRNRGTKQEDIPFYK
jgi:hypothetical protein